MIEYLVAPTTRCILISFYDRYALDSPITSIRFDSRFTYTYIYKCQWWITMERNKKNVSFDSFEKFFQNFERGKASLLKRMDNLERVSISTDNYPWDS